MKFRYLIETKVKVNDDTSYVDREFLFLTIEEIEAGKLKKEVEKWWGEGSPYKIIARDLCTNKKSKNRKEIYQNDLMTYSKHIGYYLIRWKDDNWDCGLVCEKDAPSYNYMMPVAWKDMKVVGNIYENPELLEEKCEK